MHACVGGGVITDSVMEETLHLSCVKSLHMYHIVFQTLQKIRRKRLSHFFFRNVQQPGKIAEAAVCATALILN